jgi:hypothetical protein
VSQSIRKRRAAHLAVGPDRSAARADEQASTADGRAQTRAVMLDQRNTGSILAKLQQPDHGLVTEFPAGHGLRTLTIDMSAACNANT